ncbi:hypothetical protein A2690_02090 [Candidatus Roizmanbacteria bacterium RIFCSPHIGHO2_01_FULL_39_12b]|uniref:LytR/CpsA/Psr regulator C-terminal domain-containing protein n=1 Tax=Candidatus Roizmanbacteria bacterium RIFCSPHIGHO2_01_FULL_39_12b TaxID=1802030 RepID=A0A1F7GDT4_9BACT|nr:MAG: hypothetical protein A2690_02090 [Candidatus Roizmanbacteria bacterium RIFCSPHIGHO2_01_FULL_39_12b]OGK46319.1 MAG: hypothetical protein A3B46_00060 [Candidatus Roizmanbacteria bacterium RIFCSPLOWO2_01_FULL_39_19]
MNRKVALIAIIGVVAALIAGGAILIQKSRSSQAIITPTPSFIEPTQEPEPTVEEDVDISTFKVKILNGTSVAGLAAKVQKQLEDVGFTVSGIGNADKKDYQQVVIQAKSTIPSSAVDKLKEAIGGTYTFGTQEELDDSEENDIVVIVGVKQTPVTPTSIQVRPTASATTAPTSAQTTPTPTPTPTPKT